ncbi:MAG: metallopeptidase family protein [Elusimicrobiota bacterium]|nr:metallopeptidase family protein [Elusimicrobiota bacterium]
MTNLEFEKITAQSVKDLPQFFKNKMENIIIIVSDTPTRALERKMGQGLLGLYEGVPLSERGYGYSGFMPDKITLFKKNIEAICSNEERAREEIRHVVIHEIAHHFGITDEELREQGIY